jgi:hypothetical protein
MRIRVGLLAALALTAMAQAAQIPDKEMPGVIAVIGGEPELQATGYHTDVVGPFFFEHVRYAYRDGTLWALGPVRQHIHAKIRCNEIRDIRVEIRTQESFVDLHTADKWHRLRIFPYYHDHDDDAQRIIDTLKACAQNNTTSTTR